MVATRGQHQSQAGVVHENYPDRSNGETCYEFAAYTICGAVSASRGRDRKVSSQYTFKAAAEDAVGRAKTSQKRLYFERAKPVPSAEVETADLETTLGICTNGPCDATRMTVSG